MTSPTPTQTVDDIRAGLEGVTPGEWGLCYHLRSHEHDASCKCGYRGSIWSGDGEYIIVEMGSSPDIDEAGQVQGHTQPQADRATQLADAAHIARCSPARLLPVLDEFDRLQEQVVELEAKLETANALVTCCCGSPVDTHGMGDGHSPVDMYHHAIGRMQERIAALEAERDELAERVDELESNGETVAAEFEGDCWKAMRSLLNECKFDWSGVDDEGVTAEAAREYISESIDQLERDEVSARTRALALAADLAEARKVLSEVQQQSSDGLEHTMTHALYSALEGIGDTARAFLAKEK